MIALLQKDGAEVFVQYWNELMDWVDTKSSQQASVR